VRDRVIRLTVLIAQTDLWMAMYPLVVIANIANFSGGMGYNSWPTRLTRRWARRSAGSS
jgi:hypothetical protein